MHILQDKLKVESIFSLLIFNFSGEALGDQIIPDTKCRKEKSRYDEIIQNHISGLTTHGLSRIYGGHNRVEKLFWFFAVVITAAFTLLVLHLSIQEYLRYESILDNREVSVSELEFPTLTLCSVNVFRAKMRCYKGEYNISMNNSTDAGFCPNSTHPAKWKILKCRHYMGHPYYCSKNMISREDGMCIVLNAEGGLMQRTKGRRGRLHYRLKQPHLDFRNRRNEMSLKLHRSDQSAPLDMFGVVEGLFPGKAYQIQISKSEIKRLPSPYQSNCKHEEPNYLARSDSQVSCTDQCAMQNMRDNCSATNDMWARLSSTTNQIHTANKSDNDIRLCLANFYKYNYYEAPKNCSYCSQTLCNETSFKVEKMNWIELSNENASETNIELYYDEIKLKTEIEKEVSSIISAVGKFGGWMGLLTGTSFLSILEIAVLVGLLLSRCAFERKNKQ